MSRESWWDAFRARAEHRNLRDALVEFFSRFRWDLWLTVTFSKPTGREAARSRVTRCLAGRSLLWMGKAALCSLEPHLNRSRWHAHILYMTTFEKPSSARVDPTNRCLANTTGTKELWRYVRDSFEQSCGFSRVYPIRSSTGSLLEYLLKYCLKTQSWHAIDVDDVDTDNWFLWEPRMK